MRALGAIPQVMAFSELYSALQSGVVDGTEGVPSNFYTQKIYEVQKHISLSNHGHLAYAVIVNKKFWDGLPADIRTALAGCAIKDATTYANAIAATENADALDKIKASGKTTVYTPTAAEITEWKKALMPVHKEMEARVSARRRSTPSTRPPVSWCRSSTAGAGTCRSKAAARAVRVRRTTNSRRLSMLNRVLNHLEEWLITFLIACGHAGDLPGGRAPLSVGRALDPGLHRAAWT